MSDYDRIAQAIQYLHTHLRQQPTLEQLATELQLSPVQLQGLFTRWAGTSPKRFLQVLTRELGKQLLDQDWSMPDASAEAAPSSSPRLHDHRVQLEGVTPGDYRRGGEALGIEHGVTETRFGLLFVASTARGICRASFLDAASADRELAALRRQWPGANLRENPASAAAVVQRMLAARQAARPLALHVQGTSFQLTVWRALLHIPAGRAVSYGKLAQAVQHPGAARAVGAAVGANPVAVLIPCHRVIQHSGAVGGYRWGTPRKLALQAWEKLQE